MNNTRRMRIEDIELNIEGGKYNQNNINGKVTNYCHRKEDTQKGNYIRTHQDEECVKVMSWIRRKKSMTKVQDIVKMSYDFVHG